MSRWKFPLSIAALCLLGCQHIPPKPLEIGHEFAALQDRPLDVQSVQDYAAALSAHAEENTPFSVDDGVTLREAQAIALWYNLGLRVARLEAQAVAAGADTGGLWPDPELGLEAGQKEVEQDGGFLQQAGDSTRHWINAASLSITIPVSGRIAAQRQLYTAEHEAALARAREAEAQVLQQLRDAWAQWMAAQQTVQLLEQQVALATPFTENAAALAALGETAPTGARLFQVDHARHQALLETERARLAQCRASMLQLMGLLPDAEVNFLPELPPPPGRPADSTALGNHPAIARLRAEYQVAEDRLRVELKAQYPDLTLSPTYTDEEDETSLILGLGLPIPVWNANRQGIARAAAERDTARARVMAEYQRLVAEAAQARAAHDGAHARRERLANEVAPLVDQQLEEAQALLEAGEMEVLEIHAVLSQALEAKLDLVDAALAEALAASRLLALVPMELQP